MDLYILVTDYSCVSKFSNYSFLLKVIDKFNTEFCAYEFHRKLHFSLTNYPSPITVSISAPNKILVYWLRHVFRHWTFLSDARMFFCSAIRKRRNFPEGKRRGTPHLQSSLPLFLHKPEWIYVLAPVLSDKREMIASFRGCHAMEDRLDGRCITSSRERPFCQFGHAAPSCKRDTIAIIYAALSTTGI